MRENQRNNQNDRSRQRRPSDVLTTTMMPRGSCCALHLIRFYLSYWLLKYDELLQGGHGTGKTGNLVLTFSRQGKHREFCFDTGKNFETQGKYFSVTQGKI